VWLGVDNDHLGPAPVEFFRQAQSRVQPDMSCPYDNDALRIHASIVVVIGRISAPL
jgi:hypothetical protein